MIGVEEVELHPTHLCLPDEGGDVATWEGHADGKGIARCVGDLFDGKVVEVVRLVGFLLPPSLVELLAKVTLLIEETNPGQRNTQITGRLEMVTGQYPETPGKDGEALGDPELQREVGDTQAGISTMSTLEPGGMRGPIGLELVDHTLEVSEEGRIRCGCIELVLSDGAEHQHRCPQAPS